MNYVKLGAGVACAFAGLALIPVALPIAVLLGFAAGALIMASIPERI